MSRIAAFAFALLPLAAPAWAQSFRPPDPTARPWATAQMNLGPVYVAPTFELTGVGIDNNVFNKEENPQSDLTGTLGMRSLMGLHFGEAVVFQMTQGNSYIWYRRYRSERSIDSTLFFVLEWRTRSFRPWVRWEKTKTGQRGGFEIDARAERRTPNFDFGADVNAAFRLGVSVAARRAKLSYKDTEEYDGINLGQVLNNTSDVYQGFLRYQLSELSDLVAGADYVRDRFSDQPLRDNDSYYYYAGLRTKQGAVFVGNATVGVRRQAHTDPAVPDFAGVIADLDLAVVPTEMFRLELNGGRDLDYSYLEEYPYYVEQGGGATLTNRFVEHFDVIVSARFKWLQYDKTMSGIRDPHTDRTVVLGLGTGYFVGGGQGTRLGILFERAQRVSPLADRNYVTNRFSTNYRFSF